MLFRYFSVMLEPACVWHHVKPSCGPSPDWQVWQHLLHAASWLWSGKCRAHHGNRCLRGVDPDSGWYSCALREHAAWGVYFQPEAVSGCWSTYACHAAHVLAAVPVGCRTRHCAASQYSLCRITTHCEPDTSQPCAGQGQLLYPQPQPQVPHGSPSQPPRRPPYPQRTSCPSACSGWLAALGPCWPMVSMKLV